jgi:hypothetical protein
MKSWFGRALLALTLAASCAKATEERILTGDDEGTGGDGATGGRGGSTGPGGSAGSSAASGRGGAAGSAPTGGKGGASGASGSGGTGGSDAGGASDGGEGGADPCVVVDPPSTPRVDYKEGARALTDDPGGEIHLLNATSAAIPLSELSLRYWFTSEFPCAQTMTAFTVYIDDFRFQNPHFEKSKTDVLIDVVGLDTGAPGCDAYFELGFAAATGSLEPNQYAAISYHTQLNDYTRPHSQENDYSYGACTVTHVYWDKITVYRDGRLVTGTPPGGGGEGGAGGEGSGGMGGI